MMEGSDDSQYLAATPEELRVIEELTAKPVFERLDDGDLEIVGDDDWSDVPDVNEATEPSVIRVSESLYRQLEDASGRHHKSPDELASEWLQEKLTSDRPG